MQGPLSAWVQREASSSMLMHLLLGFPTEVYAPHEYTAVYWYSDYLLGAAQQTTHTLFEMLPDPKMSRQQKRATSKGGKGKQGGKGGTGAGMSEEQAQREERKLMLVRAYYKSLNEWKKRSGAVGYFICCNRLRGDAYNF